MLAVRLLAENVFYFFGNHDTTRLTCARPALSMVEAAAAPAANAGASSTSPEPPPAPSFRNRAMYALRSFIMYMVVMQVFGGFAQPRPDVTGPGNEAVAPPRLARPLFTKGEPVDAFVYVTYDSQFAFESAQSLESDQSGLVTSLDAIRLSASPETFSVAVTHVLSTEVLTANHTPHLHVVFCRSGKTHDPQHEHFNEINTFVASAPLLKWHPPTQRRMKKLLSAAEAEDNLSYDSEEISTQTSETTVLDVQNNQPKPWLAYFNPNVTVSIVDDFTSYRYPRGIPDLMREKMRFEETSDAYWPTAYVDDFWVLRERLKQLHGDADGDADAHEDTGFASTSLDTSTSIPITFNLTIASQSVWRWQMFTQMEQSFETQRKMGTAGEHDADTMKKVLLDGDPRLLAITGVVSFLHMILETLAFKSDVSFWKSPKKSAGVSARTIIFNLISQVIILLYLLDNDTSWMVLLSNLMGGAVEAWKITKVLHVKVEGFKIKLTDKRLDKNIADDKVSSLATETAKHDETAMKYLTWLLIPLLACYSVYSVYYQEHKGWYSFIVTTLVGAVYSFGFLTMLPQLFINYKLKSVAHMPWRQMSYKFLNTIIDDLFAFVIQMPTLHRIAVFRDDLVFLGFLYQRWIYRVDKSRVNEFGFSGESEESKGKEPEESKKDK